MNIQYKAMELFGNACYAYSLAYLRLNTDDFKTLTEQVILWYSNDWIDDDGYVNSPHKCLDKKDVQKVKIKSLDELPEDGLYAVQFVYGGLNHFVVCKKGSVVFDPWEDSKAVKHGKPHSYRRFI